MILKADLKNQNKHLFLEGSYTNYDVAFTVKLALDIRQLR